MTNIEDAIARAQKALEDYRTPGRWNSGCVIDPDALEALMAAAVNSKAMLEENQQKAAVIARNDSQAPLFAAVNYKDVLSAAKQARDLLLKMRRLPVGDNERITVLAALTAAIYKAEPIKTPEQVCADKAFADTASILEGSKRNV